MKIDILTLFPSMINSMLKESIIGKAIAEEKVEVETTDIRDFTKNKHKKVDDYTFGGGNGMLMTPEPVYNAIENIKTSKSKIIYLSPKGKKYTQDIANKLSKEEHIVLICGHYEGIDNRIIENYVDEEISIGDYVLTGGELGALVLADSIIRLLPGVLREEESYTEESHYNGLLEYPQYTRPREFNGFSVPNVLISGDHKKIDEWRKYQSIKETYLKRPDLLEKRELDKKEKEILEKVLKEL